jgi:hypothetical protein
MNTECLCRGAVDGVRVTLRHKAEDIYIDISINVALEGNFLRLHSDLVKHKFDLLVLIISVNSRKNSCC